MTQRMTRTARLVLTGAALTVLAISPSAWGSLMTYNGVALSQTVQTHAPGKLADGLTTYAGQELITFENVNYKAYCVDLNQYAATAQATAVPLNLTSFNNQWQLAYLFDTYAAGVTTDLQAAALGTAIWEVLTEPNGGAFDVTDTYSQFWITGNNSVAAAANALLASLPANYTPTVWPVVLQSATAQDFIIPEPATLALLGVGGLVLLRSRRRCEARTPIREGG